MNTKVNIRVIRNHSRTFVDPLLRAPVALCEYIWEVLLQIANE
jgi:hypothetical protein